MNFNVAEPAVINASPLIFLSRAGLIDLLQILSPTILVPQVVAAEVQVRDTSDPTVHALSTVSWLIVTETPSVPPEIQSWGLGLGESSVLAWAYSHPGTEAIIDDLSGRRCAAALGVPVRGTLGLALLAKQRGRIPSARVVLEQLRKGGMYLSNAVMHEALARVGE